MENLLSNKPLLLSGKDAAACLGLSYQSFNSLVRRGDIIPHPAHKSRRKYSQAEILRFAFLQATAPAKSPATKESK